MLRKEISYVDYNGLERTENFYFNLTKTELTKMQLSTEGGLQEMLEKIVAAKDVPQIITVFDKIILAAYGEKSDDGKRFVKSEEIAEAFQASPAYDALFMELLGDPDAAAKFVEDILPKVN